MTSPPPATSYGYAPPLHRDAAHALMLGLYQASETATPPASIVALLARASKSKVCAALIQDRVQAIARESLMPQIKTRWQFILRRLQGFSQTKLLAAAKNQVRSLRKAAVRAGEPQKRTARAPDPGAQLTVSSPTSNSLGRVARRASGELLQVSPSLASVNRSRIGRGRFIAPARLSQTTALETVEEAIAMFGPGEQVHISLTPTSMASLRDIGGSAFCSREAAYDTGNIIWWTNQFPTIVSHMRGWLYVRRVIRNRQLRVEAIQLTSHHYAALMCVPSEKDDPIHVMLTHLNDRVGTLAVGQGVRRDVARTMLHSCGRRLGWTRLPETQVTFAHVGAGAGLLTAAMFSEFPQAICLGVSDTCPECRQAHTHAFGDRAGFICGRVGSPRENALFIKGLEAEHRHRQTTTTKLRLDLLIITLNCGAFSDRNFATINSPERTEQVERALEEWQGVLGLVPRLRPRAIVIETVAALTKPKWAETWQKIQGLLIQVSRGKGIGSKKWKWEANDPAKVTGYGSHRDRLWILGY